MCRLQSSISRWERIRQVLIRVLIVTRKWRKYAWNEIKRRMRDSIRGTSRAKPKRNVSRSEDLHSRRKGGWPIKRGAFGHYFSLSSSFKAPQRRTKSWAGHVARLFPFPGRIVWEWLSSSLADLRSICPNLQSVPSVPRCLRRPPAMKGRNTGPYAPPADRKIHLDRREINRTPCKRPAAFLVQRFCGAFSEGVPAPMALVVRLGTLEKGKKRLSQDVVKIWRICRRVRGNCCYLQC